VAGLENGVEYEIAVEAINTAGAAEASAVSAVRRPPLLFISWYMSELLLKL
jgi:hypothetical protein